MIFRGKFWELVGLSGIKGNTSQVNFLSVKSYIIDFAPKLDDLLLNGGHMSKAHCNVELTFGDSRNAVFKCGHVQNQSCLLNIGPTE